LAGTPGGSGQQDLSKARGDPDHPEWPCCIDVHFRFPGMENPASDCFEVMWANTDVLELAGQECGSRHRPGNPDPGTACPPDSPVACMPAGARVPGAPHGTAIAWRPPSWKSPWPPAPWQPCALSRGPPSRDRCAGWPQPSTEWRNRLMAKDPGSARLIAILQAPWQDKPKMLWRAVFPRPEVFLSGNIYADMSLRGRLLQHRARWARFLRSAPQIVRDLTSGG
jgi:hypothetical protein